MKPMTRVSFGAWAAVTPPKKNVEQNLKAVAKALADKGCDVVVEWQGKPITG
jgi:hypothetical protein